MKFELNNENMNQMKKKEAHQTDHLVLLKHQAVLENVLRKKIFFPIKFSQQLSSKHDIHSLFCLPDFLFSV